ncbi:FAD-dependent monooxygenase [Cyanobium sp. NIES-981]|uniref:FAD-dependent monooxygenase n=1 Tax=Cyanobium sp. NIES-981 TaxID=1851505 RepID=UPI0007DD61C4|nr:FAD-dependent monooxygenase [Cyanobium sp. NIES-981]SBO42799.1 VisC protein [Cyanobium sp. NIES-981]
MPSSSMATADLRALVHGAGPTGALTALALAEAGWRVHLSDPLDAAQLRARNRAYAFNHSSRRLLDRLGLWELLQPSLIPFRRLQLCDLGTGVEVPFTPADLGRRLAGGADAAAAAVGWIGLHGPLMELLQRRLAGEPRITQAMGVGSGAEPWPESPPDLVVAADGPHSPHREGLGIRVWQHTYRQSCLTAQVALRGTDPDQAWELFRPEGPFAVLPLGPGRAQLVWSAPSSRCRRLESLGPDGFLDALAEALPDRFQPDALLEPPRTFPVGLLLARRLQRGSTVLLGESAHRCHPVGGQGLNLCWRDVAVLHRLARRVAAGGLQPGKLPRAYALRRWPDLVLTLLATDLLMRIFSNRSRLLLPLRRLSLAALGSLAPLRRLSLGAMTNGPCRPW